VEAMEDSGWKTASSYWIEWTGGNVQYSDLARFESFVPAKDGKRLEEMFIPSTPQRLFAINLWKDMAPGVP
jgi:hypothetical protein